MKSLLLIGIAALFTPIASMAQQVSQSETVQEDTLKWQEISLPDAENLNDFLWKARPVVVFADSPDDPRFEQQMNLLQQGASALAERDVVVLSDTDPDAASPLRTTLRPRGFMLVLIGKDGGVKLRKPAPWTVREVSRAIDKFPSRQREVRERREP